MLPKLESRYDVVTVLIRTTRVVVKWLARMGVHVQVGDDFVPSSGTTKLFPLHDGFVVFCLFLRVGAGVRHVTRIHFMVHRNGFRLDRLRACR